MGTPQAAVPTLERLIDDGHEIVAVYTQPDRPSGRGNKIVFSPVKELALGRNIPIFQPAKVKTPEAAAEFKDLNADVAVVVAYGRILPEAFLTAFPQGAVNVHFSLLPKYRGAAPVNWAIVNGESKTGVTTMKMDAGLDTGDRLMQEETPIDPNENSIELMQRLSLIGADLCSKTLTEFGSIVPIPQDHSAATHAPIMKKSDGLIDWSMDSKVIALRIRGFQPFPTSFTFLRGKRITIWKVIAVNNSANSEPGSVIEASRDRLAVACGGGSELEIVELQLEGKKRVSAKDFVIGGGSSLGDKFGS